MSRGKRHAGVVVAVSLGLLKSQQGESRENRGYFVHLGPSAKGSTPFKWNLQPGTYRSRAKKLVCRRCFRYKPQNLAIYRCLFCSPWLQVWSLLMGPWEHTLLCDKGGFHSASHTHSRRLGEGEAFFWTALLGNMSLFAKKKKINYDPFVVGDPVNKWR